MIRKLNGQTIAFYPAKTKENTLIFEIGDVVKAFPVRNDSGYCFRFSDGCIYADGGINELIEYLESAGENSLKRITALLLAS